MDAYVYQSALLCADCGKAIRANTPALDVLSNQELQRLDFDSKDLPMGPYSNGGGEADRPQHCDHCGRFLQNPLTDEGLNYVREAVQAVQDWQEHSQGSASVIRLWQRFYL